MIIDMPETKDETIQRLQKKLQAAESNYLDLLGDFDARVKLACRDEIRKTKKLAIQIKAIQKIVGNHGDTEFS